MLELKNVSKSYRSIPAVENVSFTLREGEVLGYLGPNGSGKSTTVKMIIGLIQPTRGKVLFNGRDIHEDIATFRAQLGYVPEEAQVYTHLSGLEYLQLIGRLRGMQERVIEEKAQAAHGSAHRRLAQADRFGGARHALVLGHRCERHQQVQIDVADVHRADSRDTHGRIARPQRPALR